jgi:hypothetical protein
MKKLKKLIEIKRQLRLAERRRERAQKRMEKLVKERTKVVNSFTNEEARLYLDRIQKACK